MFHYIACCKLHQIALYCNILAMVMLIGFHYFISQGGVMSIFIHGIAPFTFSPCDQDDFDEGDIIMVKP